MEPATIALIAAGATSAIGGAISGIGQARAAKKRMLTDAEKKELADLERRRRAGELGLNERELGAIEQRFLAEQAGAQRELEATALQQTAARGLGGSVSGRDVFLQEQAQAQAEMGMRQQQNALVEQADTAERNAEKAQIASMNAQQKEAESARTAAIWGAFGAGVGGGAPALQGASQQLHETALATKAAEAQAQDTQSLMRQLNLQGYTTTGAPSFSSWSANQGGF